VTPQPRTRIWSRGERATAFSVEEMPDEARETALVTRGGRKCTLRCVCGRDQVAGVVVAAGAAVVDSLDVLAAGVVLVVELDVEDELDEPRLSVL